MFHVGLTVGTSKSAVVMHRILTNIIFYFWPTDAFPFSEYNPVDILVQCFQDSYSILAHNRGEGLSYG